MLDAFWYTINVDWTTRINEPSRSRIEEKKEEKKELGAFKKRGKTTAKVHSTFLKYAPLWETTVHETEASPERGRKLAVKIQHH
jgi:hypothetical protein